MVIKKMEGPERRCGKPASPVRQHAHIAVDGGPLPRGHTNTRCGGQSLRIEVVEGGTSLSVMQFDLDFSSVIAIEAPRRTPEAKVDAARKQASQRAEGLGRLQR